MPPDAAPTQVWLICELLSRGTLKHWLHGRQPLAAGRCAVPLSGVKNPGAPILSTLAGLDVSEACDLSPKPTVCDQHAWPDTALGRCAPADSSAGRLCSTVAYTMLHTLPAHRGSMLAMSLAEPLSPGHVEAPGMHEPRTDKAHASDRAHPAHCIGLLMQPSPECAPALQGRRQTRLA